NEQTESLLVDDQGRVRAVQLQNGDVNDTDMVVMAAGIRPNTELDEQAGLPCNRGILVNDTFKTYDPRIYAIRECVSHRG
ncbi:FAD-dependent oxidoreductase, partial [Pseudomonas syringae pv. tagetis]|uniref:FAD-dependent oxidoreductase n=1 Tax=Pseudomonas syringae group genomosp. 7 TaxID=251699 RepID=UPI00376F7F86